MGSPCEPAKKMRPNQSNQEAYDRRTRCYLTIATHECQEDPTGQHRRIDHLPCRIVTNKAGPVRRKSLKLSFHTKLDFDILTLLHKSAATLNCADLIHEEANRDDSAEYTNWRKVLAREWPLLGISKYIGKQEEYACARCQR